MPVQRLSLYLCQQTKSFFLSDLICMTKYSWSKGKEQGHKQVLVCLSPADVQSISNLRPWLQQLLILSGPSFYFPKDLQTRWHICHQADFREGPWKLRKRVTSVQMNPQEKTSWNVELVIMNLSKPSRKHRWQLALVPETM